MLPTLFAQGMGFVAAMVERVRGNIEHAQQRLAGSAALRLRPPDGGYYLFPAVAGWPDEEALVLHLLTQGVLVHPGFFYGDVPGTHLMLSALTEPDHFAAGLERLAHALH
jgi:aspartate/methionine/tyrosine aminotransferase